MRIRLATPNEYALIRQQRVQAYAQYAAILPETHWHALRSAISSAADLPEGTVTFVAEDESQIMGSIVLFPPQSSAYGDHVQQLAYPEIRMLAVDPVYRGRGVASALVKACIDSAKASKFAAVGLHTADFMEQAMRLYTKLGFLREPQHDFEPANDGIVVKAFRLSLSEA